MATSGELCIAVATALGISFETTREHLRNIRRAGMISFKGHGRGAAAMTTLDASRLLITASGSPFVKDSIETLRGFGELKPINQTSRPLGMTLETFLANVMQKLIDEKDDLPPEYRRPLESGARPGIGLRMMSVVSARPGDFPRTASVRRFLKSGLLTKSSYAAFASNGLSAPTFDSSEFLIQLRKSYLVQTRDVPASILAEIAHAL